MGNNKENTIRALVECGEKLEAEQPLRMKMFREIFPILSDMIEPILKKNQRLSRKFTKKETKAAAYAELMDKCFESAAVKAKFRCLDAAYVLGEENYKLLKIIHLTGDTPFKIIESGRAPAKLHKREDFYTAVRLLVKDHYLIKKPINKMRSEYWVNARKIKAKFGVGCDQLFEKKAIK